MKLAYMYATPDVVHSEVTAIQGDVDFCFELIKQTGYTGVELLLANPKEVSVPTIAQAAANSGLDIPALCTGEVYGQDGLSFADPDPKKRQQAIDRMKYAMDIGGYFNAPVNVGRLRGRYQKNIEKEQTLDWIRQALIQCAEEFPEVPIVMEPVNHLYANCLITTDDMLRFVLALNHPRIGMMLDMAHILIEEENLPESVEKVHKHGLLWHFHLSDSDRLPMGDGKYKIKPVINALHENHYDRYVTVETFQIPDSDYAIKRSFEVLEPYF